MRSDSLYLRDIVPAGEDTLVIVADMTPEAFRASMLHSRAALQALTEIGEAAAKVSSELRRQHNNIEWAMATKLRNVAVHQYFGIDYSIIYDTIIQDVPPLIAAIRKILDSENIN